MPGVRSEKCCSLSLTRALQALQMSYEASMSATMWIQTCAWALCKQEPRPLVSKPLNKRATPAICRGNARKFGLSPYDRKSALGTVLGKRSALRLSGTMCRFALMLMGIHLSLPAPAEAKIQHSDLVQQVSKKFLSHLRVWLFPAPGTLCKNVRRGSLRVYGSSRSSWASTRRLRTTVSKNACCS